MYNLSVCLYTQGSYHNSYHYVSKAIEINSNVKEYQELKEQIRKILYSI